MNSLEPVSGVAGRADPRADREDAMIPLPSGTRIWLVAGAMDMRKSFNGLGEQIQHVLDEEPFSGQHKTGSCWMSVWKERFA